jgi:hypothetical protein
MPHLNGFLPRLLLPVFLLVLSPEPSRADEFQLAEADASYRLVVNGIPLGLEAQVDLVRDDDNWHLSFLIDSRLVYHREDSRFSWNDCRARSSRYQYESRGFGIKRGGAVTFDWRRKRALTEDGYFRLPEHTVDALAATMVARCYLASGAEAMTFAVADPGGLSRYRFQVVAREALKTPAGEFDTIRVKRVYGKGMRKTEMWVAVDLDYFMVRMDHAENPLMQGRIELTRIQAGADSDQRGQAGNNVSSR